jgi:methionine-rich copper-binding protein CopC
MILAAVGRAFAHAVLVEVAPSAHAYIHGPEVVFRLRFNSRIEAARSVLNLILPDQSSPLLPIKDQPSPDSLSAKATVMKDGAYTLRWQVLTADGQITRGEVPFDVR